MAMIDTSMVGIKRSDDSTSSLDSLFDYDAGDVESVKEVEAKDNPVNLALCDFTKYLDLCFDDQENYVVDLILTPSEIKSFVNIGNIDNLTVDYHLLLSDYTSRLIQKSYDNRYNHFKFDSNINNLKYFGNKLKGNEENPIIIETLGGINSHFLAHAKNVIARINGNLQVGFAIGSTNVTAFIFGNVGNYFGINSFNLSAYISNNAGGYFGSMSEKLSAYIEGNVEDCFANHSSNLSAIVKGEVGFIFETKIKNLTLLHGRDIEQSPEFPLLLEEIYGGLR
jgi:hypothetical protein